MTTALTDNLIHLVIERGWNRGDVGALDEAVAPGYVRHLSDGRTLRSRDEFKQHILATRAAMPDLRTDVHLSFTDGTHSATTFTFAATAAGRPLRFDGAVIVRIEDGKLAEEWEYFDTAAIEAALR